VFLVVEVVIVSLYAQSRNIFLKLDLILDRLYGQKKNRLQTQLQIHEYSLTVFKIKFIL
jgi:hypothetical protein